MFRHLMCLLFLSISLLFPAFAHADIRIYGLEDFRLGKWVLGSGSLRANANLCVVVRPSAPYQITVYGDGPSNAYTLSNAGDGLPYRVFYNDQPRPNRATELTAGQALGGLRARRGNSIRRDCNRQNANISILISESDLEQASSGRYSGTITIVVGPE